MKMLREILATRTKADNQIMFLTSVKKKNFMFLMWQILFGSINEPLPCRFHVEPPFLENGLDLLNANGTWYDVDPNENEIKN